MYPPDSEPAQTMLYIKAKMKGSKSQNIAFQSNNNQPCLLQIGSVLNSQREHTRPESNPPKSPSPISLFVNFDSESFAECANIL